MSDFHIFLSSSIYAFVFSQPLRGAGGGLGDMELHVSQTDQPDEQLQRGVKGAGHS